MKIAVGSDHAGYEGPEPCYKPKITKHLEEQGHEVLDCGTGSADAADYPDFADRVSEAILGGKAEYGVLVCGTGVGMSMAANRHRGIRAAACANAKMAQLSREHNEANILCLGRRILPIEECLEILDIWLETSFSGAERHVRRVSKMG